MDGGCFLSRLNRCVRANHDDWLPRHVATYLPLPTLSLQQQIKDLSRVTIKVITDMRQEVSWLDLIMKRNKTCVIEHIKFIANMMSSLCGPSHVHNGMEITIMS